jgi:NhaP-type Na+/H+ or K+/H+ antiporter
LKLDYELKRVLSLALFPYALEVFILSILIFNLIPNISILGAVTLSSVLPTIGPAIVTQIQIGFLNQRRGLDKNMPILLLSSTVFECIQSIIIFGVLSEIYLFSSNPK